MQENMYHTSHELCEIFPKMSESEFRTFKENIKNEGVQNPIVLHDGKILDGYHRYRACRELGILPPLTVFEGKDPVDYVWSQNIERRHLMPGQIATINAKMNLYRTLHPQVLSEKESSTVPTLVQTRTLHPQVLSEKESSTVPTLVQTVRSMASESGISKTTQNKADMVLREAPELSEQVLKGDFSLEKAYQKVKARREPATRPSFERPKTISGSPKNLSEPSVSSEKESENSVNTNIPLSSGQSLDTSFPENNSATVIFLQNENLSTPENPAEDSLNQKIQQLSSDLQKAIQEKDQAIQDIKDLKEQALEDLKELKFSYDEQLYHLKEDNERLSMELYSLKEKLVSERQTLLELQNLVQVNSSQELVEKMRLLV